MFKVGQMVLRKPEEEDVRWIASGFKKGIPVTILGIEKDGETIFFKEGKGGWSTCYFEEAEISETLFDSLWAHLDSLMLKNGDNTFSITNGGTSCGLHFDFVSKTVSVIGRGMQFCELVKKPTAEELLAKAKAEADAKKVEEVLSSLDSNQRKLLEAALKKV